MKNHLNISLIIPYYNEKNEVLRTIKKILNQDHVPKEIILVNSSSNDNSYQIVDNFIRTLKIKYVRIKNISKGTKFPSTSKNLGIKNSKYKLVSFIDCGLKLKKNWLYNQYNLLKKKKLDCVFGNCYFNPIDSLNIAIILNTYGYKSNHSVIPSSIFKKKIFKEIGYFPKKRAGYDWSWILNVKKSHTKFGNSPKKTIIYHQFVKNIRNLSKKIFLYSYHSYEFQPLFKKLLYIFAPIYFFFSIKFILLNIFLYFLLRFIFIVFKSNFFFKIINLNIFFYLLAVIPLIDASRSFGFYFNFFKFNIK